MKNFGLLFASGLLFALGLGVAGMTNANKVIGFLDVAGDWDPSLAFVMGGAIGVHFLAYRMVGSMERPLFAARFGVPTRHDIDARLLGGAALFGVGWALGGYCPGPGLTSLAAGSSHAWIFVASMIVGMWLFQQIEAGLRRQETAGVRSSMVEAAGDRQ
jgi:uncharacterized membrane protein YedE/YeeE